MSDLDYLKKYLDKSKLENGIKKLEQGVPVQYIVGNTNFYGNIIKVNENVLIPRFETELLVEKTIKYINKIFDKKVKIIDLGTGSGCIAITLKKEIDCVVDAVDISAKALSIANENAIINNVDINFIHGDMLKSINDKYDIIISNPPYISYEEDIMDLVKNNEPHLALYADNNGLYFYEEILKKCSNNLKDKYLIAFEIGMNQAKDIELLAKKYLKNIKVVIEKDLSNRDRYIFITNLDNNV